MPPAPTPAPPASKLQRDIAPTTGPVEPGVLNVLASPAVRRLARELGVNLGAVPGTGRMGRITAEDVAAYHDRLSAQAAATAPAAAPSPAEAAPQAEGPSPGSPPCVYGRLNAIAPTAATSPAAGPRAHPDVDEELVPLTPMRRAIADHMARSAREAPHVTTVAEVDMTGVARRRDAWKAAGREGEARLTYTVFIASAVARALREYPDLNASWTERGILLKYRINLGLAVAVEDGLVVPVIRDADRLGLLDLARAIQRAAEKTREGKMSPTDVGGGTFTITNPGVFGAVLSTPIIHQPQAAILAMGRVADVPAVVNGGFFIRKRMYLSLSYDHRVVDGATAVKFLQRVRQRLEGVEFDGSPDAGGAQGH
jgi:2-oxoisovalerate dehydrogenase E2 component (dihydrolipoyl transacylase)